MLSILLFIRLVCSLEIVEIKDKEQAFKVHLQQQSSVLTLPKAVDAKLISYDPHSICSVVQRTVETESQEFTIIQEKEFTELDFEFDTPLNFRQFIAIAHIRDGMLAVTSDSVIFMLKFNYNNIHETDQFQTYGNGKEFAAIVWRADIQTIAPSEQSKSEMPQLVFAAKSNVAIVAFSDNAQIFAVSQMEAKSKTLDVYMASNWMPRKVRGLTKEMDGLVFSAVGAEGLDIYRINQMDLRFVRNLKLFDLGLTDGLLYVVDFCLWKRNDNEYQLYLLDQSRGLIGIDILSHGVFIEAKLILNSISPKSGGIAVDSKNGKNVFVAYKEIHTNVIIEYVVNFETKEWEIVNQVNTDSKVFDVDATDEFAIIQGLNHHRIIFSNNYQFAQNEPLVFTHMGLRDFEFFRESHQMVKLGQIEDEYQFDDFFFGITATHAFLTKFKVNDPRVNCYTDQVNLTQTRQDYTLQYNETQLVNGQVNKNLVIHHSMNFTVELVKTYLYEDQILALQVLGGLLGLIALLSMSILCYWWHSFKKEQLELEQQISQFKNRQQHEHDSSQNKIQVDQSVDQKQNEI